MQVYFKQQVNIGKKHFRVGFHHVDEETLKTKYFEKLLSSGLVVDGADMKKKTEKPVDPKQKAFADQLMKRSAERAKRSVERAEAEAAVADATKKALEEKAEMEALAAAEEAGDEPWLEPVADDAAETEPVQNQSKKKRR